MFWFPYGLFSAVLGLYTFGKSDGVHLFDLIQELILLPAMGVIFANFMPSKLNAYLAYLALWVLFATGCEWIMVFKVHYL